MSLPSFVALLLGGLWLAPASVADRLHSDSTRSGIATFYHSRSGIGTCTLPPTAPWDSFYVSVNRKDFAKSLACGACMVVRHDTDSVLVRISDRCPGCRPGGLDLSRAAFRRLAPLGAGRIPVSWRYVACPDSSLVIRRTKGSSRFWSSLQVWGLPWPVESLSVADDGRWIRFHRERHNHFTARDLPSAPWTLRTVDVHHAARVDSALNLDPGTQLPLEPVDSTDSED
jgi:expansin (peptidoglycan-binding protein)